MMSGEAVGAVVAAFVLGLSIGVLGGGTYVRWEVRMMVREFLDAHPGREEVAEADDDGC